MKSLSQGAWSGCDMKPINHITVGSSLGVTGNTSISTLSGDANYQRYMQMDRRIEPFKERTYHSQGNVIQERNVFQDLSAEWLERQWISTPVMDDFVVSKEKTHEQLMDSVDQLLKELKSKRKALEEDGLQQNKEPCDIYPSMDNVD